MTAPPPQPTKPRLGPPAPGGTVCCVCAVPRPAALECEGCGGTFCVFHWFKHSHTDAGMIAREPRRNDQR